VQDSAGAYNAKRVYFPAALAERLGIRGWASVTHVMVALRSSESLHALRLREQTFRSICPDPLDPFAGWWSGQPPERDQASTLVVLDPAPSGRQPAFVGLDNALTVRPRYRDYADAAAHLTGSR